MGQKRESVQIYDQVFWTAVNSLTRYVPALVNEAFGTHYTSNAKIVLKAGKQVTDRPGKGFTRREEDALIGLTEFGTENDYHFECETDGRRTIALRLVQYASGYAAQNVSMIQDEAVLKIPHSAVIFLRASSTKTSALTIRIEYPGGTVSYQVPVLQIRDYTIDELFQKELYLLIPFAVFRFSDSEFDQMNQSDIHLLKQLIESVGENMNQAVAAKKLEPWERGNLMRYMQKVLDALTFRYEHVKKEAEVVMGGYILRTDIDHAMEEGRQEGREEGRQKGREEGLEEGREEGRQEGIKTGWIDGQLNMLKQLVSEGIITKEVAEIRKQSILQTAMPMAENAAIYDAEK